MAAAHEGPTVDDTTRLPLEPGDTGGLAGTLRCPVAAAELGAFLDAMPAAFCLLDADWRFRYVNAAAETLLGRTRAAVTGTSLWAAFPGMAGSVFEASYRAAVASGEPVTFEAASPGAGHGWFEVRAWPGPGGLAVYLLDVTDRRRAEDTSRRAVEHAALLAEVRAELAIARDTESALARLAQLVVPTLTDGCIVTVVDREGHVRDIGSWHADPARRALMQEYTRVRLDTLPSASPVARALDSGTPVTESVNAVLALMGPGRARDLLMELGPSSATVLPLTAEDRTVGVLTLYQDPGHTRPPEDVATARQVAAHAARAIARAHRQRRQAELAEALQRSLLTDPPDLGSTAVAVRYVPAAEAARVGGDWYDAFLQRDGSPVVVIGDVVGHDTEAAARHGAVAQPAARDRALQRRRPGGGPARPGRGHRRDAHRHPGDGDRRPVRATGGPRAGVAPAAVGQRGASAAHRDRARRVGAGSRRSIRRPAPGGRPGVLPRRAGRAGPARAPRCSSTPTGWWSDATAPSTTASASSWRCWATSPDGRWRSSATRVLDGMLPDTPQDDVALVAVRLSTAGG